MGCFCGKMRFMIKAGIRVGAALVCGLALLSSTALAQSRAQIFQQGTEALYNLDFAGAEARFRQLTEIEPDNPNNWNYVASAMWLKIMASQEKLNMESFSGAAIGTESSQDVVTPKDEQALRDTLKTAIAKADAILNKKETRNDTRALYAKGVSKGTLAAFEAIAKKSYKAALDNARESRDLHEKVLQQDPKFTDARLSIGIYKYAVGSIPRWLRFFLLLWSGGDKEGGLADVAAVAKGDGLASTDAKMLLVVLYNREKQYDKSLETLADLHKRYPRNYLLELSGAAVQARMANFDKAIATYKVVLEKIDGRRDGYDRLEAPKVMLLMAKASTEGKTASLPEARRIWTSVIADRRSTDADRANARLWMGRWYDLEGQRDKALEQYDAILKLDLKSAPAIKEEATRLKKQPFRF
jgi:tetratricopeptide (TPR) repeat protein